MDINKRFDQLESLLVDLARKQDQQTGQIAQLIDQLNRQGQAINQQGESISRQEKLLSIVSEQADGIIEFLKLSAARHAETEQRQDAVLVEIREQGREVKEQGRRLDEAMQIQIQMLQLMRAGNEKADGLAQRLLPLETQEPRIKRLEDEVFRAAS